MTGLNRQVARGHNAGDYLGLWDEAAGQSSSSQADLTPAARVLSSRILTLRKNIPAELRERRQWVAARITPDPDQPGKTKKVPVDPHTGKAAKSNDSTTWGGFEDAVMCMTRDGLQAVGYVFAADDPYCGIDFDHVIDADGNLEQWVRDYLRLLNGYAERSQSGTGVHVIVRATLPPGGRHGVQVEIYDRGRFFVMTGDVIDGYTELRDAQDAVNQLHREQFGEAPKPTPKPTRQPAQPVNLADAELIAKAQAAVNGAKFTALWNGNTAGYPSHSEADAALCMALGFWAGGDAGRVDSLFRESALMRDKWDKQHHSDGRTYGEMTVTNALARVTEFYDGNGRQPPDLSYAPDREPADPPAWLDDDGAELAYTPSMRKSTTAAQPSKRKAERITSWTAAELLAAEFPEPQFAVPGVIPVGLTFLGGRPKVGKSWLAMQCAIAVGTGGLALGRRVTQGGVLYLALEDNGRRLKERTAKQGMPATARIRFETTWPRLNEGGLAALDAAIAEHKYTFIVIDTLGRLVGRARTDDYGDMTDLLGGLQDLALAHDVAILALDHHRKAAPGSVSDPVDDIVGSTAKSGAADALLGLSKEQGKRGATLKVTGRDVEWQDLALSWDAITCCWQVEGTTEEVAMQGNRNRVVEALRANDAPMTLTEIAESTGGDKGNLHSVVNDLVTEGVVERLPKQGREVPYRLK